MKIGNPVISVVIPAYNEEKLIGRCLASLKNQKFNLPYEVIVVDNNSTDNTAKLAKGYGIILVHEKIKGIGAARQRGNDIAKAEIIAQTDADSFPTENWLSEIYNTLNSYKEIVGVSGPTYSIGEYDKLHFDRKLSDSIFNFLAFRAIPLFMRNGAFRGANVAFKKEALEKVGGYRTAVKYLEDGDMNIRIKKVGKVIYNPKMIVYSSARRVEKEGTIKVLLIQAWFTLKLLLQKNPKISARTDIR